MMPVSIDLSLVLQAVATALLLAVGRTVYQSSVKLAELNVALEAHTKQDAEQFSALHDQVQDIRTRQTAPRKRGKRG